MPCKTTLYKLRLSDPKWEDWQDIRKSLAETLAGYKPHTIRLTVDPHSHYEAGRQEAKRKAVSAGTLNG